MLNNTHTINTNADLAIATKTNKPVVPAPEAYQKHITNVAISYINNYLCRHIDKNTVGLAEVISIARNRFENLTVEAIEDGTITKPADVVHLLRGNAKMQPYEEHAIIEAYKNGIEEEAKLYIQLFFSFKVLNFMKNARLIGSDNEADIYLSLQEYLYTLVDRFDLNVYSGLSTGYYGRAMLDFYYEELNGKQYALLSYNRRQALDLYKAQKITQAESREFSYDELAKKQGIAKSNVILHFTMSNVVRLDADHINVDGETCSYHEVVEDKQNDLENSEKAVDFEHMIKTLKKKQINEAVVRSVLAAILSYTYTKEGVTKQGRIRKLSHHKYCEIADELSISVHVVEEIIKTFTETFAA